MNIGFKLHKVLDLIVYTIIPEDGNYSILHRFTDTGWTPQKIQTIIDGIEQSKTSDQRYEWANEDVHLVSIKDENVFFFDLMARRAGIQSENQDFQMSHDDFIAFLQDFKTFVEENS